MTRGFGFTGRQPTAVTAAVDPPSGKAVERGLLQTSARDGQPRCGCMHSAEYYRDQAARARRVAMIAHQPDVRNILQRAAQDYDDIAEDIDAGAVEIRHAELLPQNYRS